jgi:hypothetical protein
VGLLNRLFGRSPSPTAETRRPSPVPTYVTATLYSGAETLEVVGESFYQDALWRIVGGRRSDRVRHDVVSLLVPEPDNPYDENAIKVLIDGQQVGHLSADDAAEYLPGLLGLIGQSASGAVALAGVVVGGGIRPDGIGMLGVFLDHDPTDFGIEPRRSRSRGFSTGFAEALATDLIDDSYDFSWFHELSPNDATAITQLRRQLETDPDPIDRHYVMCELENRLYKSRDAFTSALEEFDAVCEQHDAEMVSIRPALVTKFGKVPLLGFYRQAAIRCQKSKDWELARRWAERGLIAYGEAAADSDHVEDLRKRVAYALGKLEAPAPKRRAATNRSGGAPEAVIEVLVCATCGGSFERTRTRGRKPHECPACRGVAPESQ